MLRISLSQWQAFVATEEQGNFRKAAEDLNKTQSAIAHSVRKMEDTLGHQLFSIHEREARITQVGKLLLPHARTVLEDARKAESLCNLTCMECEEGQGKLSIAVTTAFPTNVLLGILEDVSRLYPDLSFELYDIQGKAAEDMLTKGHVRIAIDVGSARMEAVETLGPVPFLYVAAPQHKLVGRSRIGPQDLMWHRQIIVRDFAHQQDGLSESRHWNTTHFWRAKELLFEGDGYAWLPLHLVQDDIAAQKLCKLDVAAGGNSSVDLVLGYRECEETCEVVLTFVSILRDAIAEFSCLNDAPSVQRKTGT